MQFQEHVHIGAGDHFGIEHAREAEDHHEQIERGEFPADDVGAEMGPVALGLAAGWGLEAHHRFFPADAIGPGEVLEDAATAGIAERLDLLEEDFGGELRELSQPSQEIVPIRLELRWRALLRNSDRRTGPAKCSSHRVAGDVQPAGDGPNGKTLPVKGNDVHPLLQFDQLTPPRQIQEEPAEKPTSLGVGQFQIGASGSVSHRQRHPLLLERESRVQTDASDRTEGPRSLIESSTPQEIPVVRHG